ncbi:MAG: hypothetical protein DRQ88_03455 [Epsilonproteobacteria bacterium]|nr:MAG: hypothetical protein DRQ89_01305 [Campylobacterota bacterium]RLA67376.1 MAG: hypothetical protein DRQ88_03455 [Campylobacterota bacterium]
MRKIILLIVLLPLASNARKNHFSLGLEAFNQFTGKTQVNNEGTLNYFSPQLFIASEYFINIDKENNFSLHPNISFGIPRTNGDENTHSMTIVGSFAAGWTLDQFLLQVGLGLELNLIWANGGTERLNNGDTYTDFWLPSGLHTSRNLIINFSGDWFFLYNWALRTGGYVYNLESSHKRSLSYFFGVHYHFGAEK